MPQANCSESFLAIPDIYSCNSSNLFEEHSDIIPFIISHIIGRFLLYVTREGILYLLFFSFFLSKLFRSVLSMNFCFSIAQ